MIIHNVEQNSQEWLELRAGKPTASEFKKIITSSGEPSKSLDGYAETLAGELYAGKPLDLWDGSKYTDYGHDMEAEARAWYEFTHQEVKQVGFVTDDNNLYGCSPDSLTLDNGSLEIKNLPKNHIKVLRYYHKHKKCPTDYYAQCQGQIGIAELDYCALLFYSPILPKLVIRIERDDVFQAKLATQLKLVLEERDKILKILKEF